MLREAFFHPKFSRLAQLLDVPVAHARGVVVSLWLYAGLMTPDGGIGHFSDGDLAATVGWCRSGEDPEEVGARIVQAMLTCRLLDPLPPPKRLYIHNWHRYADDQVRQRLRSQGSSFANGTELYGSSLRSRGKRGVGKTAIQGAQAAMLATDAHHARAEQLWKQGGRRELEVWTGRLTPLASDVRHWRETVAALLAKGYQFDAALFPEVTARTKERFSRYGKSARPTPNWWLNTLVEMFEEPKKYSALPPPPSPPPQFGDTIKTAAPPTTPGIPHYIAAALQAGPGSPAWEGLSKTDRSLAEKLRQRMTGSAA